MQIAFLWPYAPPRIDGVSDYVCHLIRSLRQAGHDARLITGRDQKASDSWIHPVVDRWRGKDVAAALESVPGFKPDWACLQFVSQAYGRAGICLSSVDIPRWLHEKTGCRVLVTFHEVAFSFEWNLKKTLLWWLSERQVQRLFRGVDAAVVTCESNAQRLKSLNFSGPVEVIPAGSNILPVEMSKEERAALRTRYFGEGTSIFSVFGRFTTERDYGLLLDLLKELRLKGVKAGLWMLGEMRESNAKGYDDLMKKAEDLGVRNSICGTGRLSAPDLSKHLAASDFFVFPQLSGISTRNTTLMAALAHDLPVLSFSPRPGHFQGYKIPRSFEVPENEKAAFGRKTAEFAAARVPAQDKSNQEYFQKHFSWDRIRSGYLEIFKINASHSEPFAGHPERSEGSASDKLEGQLREESTFLSPRNKKQILRQKAPQDDKRKMSS